MTLMRYCLLITTFWLGTSSVLAQNVGSYGRKPMPGDTGPPAPDAAGFDQKLGEMLTPGLVFHDHDGKPVTIEGLANGKPTVLILAYFRCPKLCNQVIGATLESMKDVRKRDASFVAGGPYNLVIVSIDPKEPVALARQRRELFLQDYDNRDPKTPGVWFLTASEGQGTNLEEAEQKIHKLADSVGYRYSLRANSRDYFYTPEEGWKTKTGDPLRPSVRNYEYIHSSGICFLAPDGKITRYLLGINYDATSFRQAVVEASGGKVGDFFDRNVSQFCYVYDQTTGHYRLTMRFVAIAFIPFMLGVLGMTYWTIRRGLREQPLTLPKPQQSLPDAEPGSSTESSGR